MEKELLSFEKKGCPSIKIYENHFEVKDKDYWEFRKFLFSEVSSVTLTDPNASWWKKIYSNSSLTAMIFSKDDPWELKVLLKNGGDWIYPVSPKFNSEFRIAIRYINEKLN